MSTLHQQIWTDQLMKPFYSEASFLKYVRDFSAYANYNTINIADAGFDPKVIVNNTTYPVAISERQDNPLSFPLDILSTENTIVGFQIEVETAYNKLESVIFGHRQALQNSVSMKAAHAFAPKSNTEFTPVIQTTGEDNSEGQKRITINDILKLKRSFDLLDVPSDKRFLVLDPRHLEDLILFDLKSFKDVTDISNGTPKRFAGFNILEYTKNPIYNANTLEKKAFGQVAEPTDAFCSFTFNSDKIIKADGDVKMFARTDDPELRGTVVGFDKRFIALPIRDKAIGAIVSTKI